MPSFVVERFPCFSRFHATTFHGDCGSLNGAGCNKREAFLLPFGMAARNVGAENGFRTALSHGGRGARTH